MINKTIFQQPTKIIQVAKLGNTKSGTTIHDAAVAAVQASKEMGLPVEFKFSGITVPAKAKVAPEVVERLYEYKLNNLMKIDELDRIKIEQSRSMSHGMHITV